MTIWIYFLNSDTLNPNYMKPTTNVSKFLCSLVGHRYRETRKVTPHISEYKCTCCHREITTSVNGRYDVLTPRLKEANETLARFYQKRHRVHHQVA